MFFKFGRSQPQRSYKTGSYLNIKNCNNLKGSCGLTVQGKRRLENILPG